MTTQKEAALREALEAVIADLDMRAKIQDPDEPVLDISNGVLERARAALAALEERKG